MEHKKALIVDDETDTCFLLKSILKQMDYDASFVNSLNEADRQLQKELPDVIFLDNHLKDGVGIDYIPYIRDHYPEVKVILITAFDTPVYRKQASENGADHFLGKPFSRKIINEALETIFTN